VIAIVLVAAVADNGVIGRGNAMPWRLGSDLKRFKALTMGKPVVMGRKTYLSIGKPLPGRTNIVVSRNAAFATPGVLVAGNLDCALSAARGDALRRGVDEIMVIGGTDIFTQCMPLADRLEITHVHTRPDGDTYFPPINQAAWRVVERTEHPAGPRDEASFSCVSYSRAEVEEMGKRSVRSAR
jgi:dihydrofolate reductase